MLRGFFWSIGADPALDSATSNLANANTTGSDALGSQLNKTMNGFGVLGGNSIDLGPGALATPGNPLDVAIEGAG